MNKSRSKRISILLAFLLVLPLLVSFPRAGNASNPNEINSGSGTQTDPWMITTPEELDNVRNYLGSGFAGKYFKLGNDIDLSAYLSPGGGGYGKWGAAGWLPIGGSADEEQFTGVFDGQGYTITGLSIKRPTTDYVGLFAVIGQGGVVSNVGLKSVDVIGNDYAGGLAGAAIGSVNNSYTTGSVKGGNYAGGLLGTHLDAMGSGFSTPFVFTSDSEGKYHFVKKLGLLLRHYKLFYSLPNDYVKLDPGLLQPRDGAYHINITNEFNEISYLDRVSLLTFDHQPGYTPAFSFLQQDQENNEDAFIKLVSTNPTHVVSVKDLSGFDYTEAVSSRDDGKWTSGGSKETNFFNPVEINLGDLSHAQHINLLLEGTTDINLLKESGLGEGKLDINTLKRMVQVPDENGEWVDAYSQEELRQPLNAPSLKFIDLTNKFVANDYRVRVGFNFVKWDYIAVDTSAPPEAVKTVQLPEVANLHFRGFSATDKTTYPDWTFDYDNVSPIPEELYAYQSGSFTRFGDVTSLMQMQDDHFVVMHYGDELSLHFHYTEPGSGMERSFVLYGAVWYKSAREDFGRTVDPLPFVGMNEYPYANPASFPEKDYAQEWNTRKYTSRGGPSHTIRASYSTAKVEGSNYVGGLVGQLKDKDIYDSYATGSVSGVDSVGGLAGSNEGSGKVMNSYASGTVIGGTNVGGLVGLNSGTVTASFYDRNTTGQSDIGKGDPKTTAQMKDKTTFTDANWVFSTSPIWTIDPNDQVSDAYRTSYPYFPWQTGRVDYAPPVFTGDYPDVMNIGSSALDLKAETDEAAAAWYVVLPKDAGRPTAVQIKAGTDASDNPPVAKGSLTLSAQTVATVHVTGLISNTDYDIYLVSEDSAGNLQPDVNVAKITAHTASPTYSVTYNGNGSTGGSPPKDSNAYHQGDTVAVFGNEGSLTRPGYSFVGWNAKEDGTGTDFAAGATFLMGSSNETLYAKWVMNVPGVPTVNVPTAGDGQVSLSWNTVTAATYYKLYQSTVPGSYGMEIATVTGSTYMITGLSNGTRYYYVIKAVNEGGDSAVSNEVSAVPQVPALGVPTGVTATGGNAKITLIWDGVTGATGYKIYRSVTSGTYGTEIATVTGSTYTITGLSNGTTYYFVIKATNLGGDSPASSEVSATPMTVPDAPTGVNASAGNGQATVTFAAPADNGGSRIMGYTVTSIPDGITASGTTSPITVTGLTKGTAYTFTVVATNVAGDSTPSALSNAVSPSAPSSSGSTSGNMDGNASSGTNHSGVEILVNGKAENAGTATTTKRNDQTVATITIDPKKLEEKLAAEGQHALITVPITMKSDIVVGELDGQMMKHMQQMQAVLEIKTGSVSYTLPTHQIDLSSISRQIGESVALQDIKIQIEIAAPTVDMEKIIEKAAEKGTFTLTAPSVDFRVKAVSGDTTVEVSQFKAYVERTIAIPDGVDPNKITTGIVVEPDGTVRHVPTKIGNIEGKYYAQINSLTNSAYSVVWHPLEFKDVVDHWAKAAVNDMGSRMVVSGTGEEVFSPDRDITRAEFAAIMVRGLGLRLESGEGNFTDVKQTDWYSSAIQTAYEYGLITGYEDGSSRPNEKITREQAMLIVSKAMAITELPGKKVGQNANSFLGAFSDVDNVSNWALNGVADSVSAGIISGRSSDGLAPKAFITRAEVAIMMQRLLQKSDLINE